MAHMQPPAMLRSVQRSPTPKDWERCCFPTTTAPKAIGNARTPFARLDRIRENCGELCAINDLESLEKYTVAPKNETAVSLRQFKVPVDYGAIMLDEEIHASHNTIPETPPAELLPYYTMGGAICCGFSYVNTPEPPQEYRCGHQE